MDGDDGDASGTFFHLEGDDEDMMKDFTIDWFPFYRKRPKSIVDPMTI